MRRKQNQLEEEIASLKDQIKALWEYNCRRKQLTRRARPLVKKWKTNLLIAQEIKLPLLHQNATNGQKMISQPKCVMKHL